MSFALRLLKRRVGPLPAAVEKRVRALAPEELEELGEALFGIATLPEVEVWLSARAAGT